MPTHVRIQEWRKKRGLSLAKLADLLHPYLPGLSKGDLSYIENGKRAVKADEVPIFAKVLECRPADLLDDVPE